MALKRKSLSLERKYALAGYIFSLPWILGFLLFAVYPFVTSFILSVSKIVNLEGLKTRFVGLSNYVYIFTVDTQFVPAFLQTLKVTLIYTPFILVISLFVAILLNKKIKGRSIFRVIFFLPFLLGSGFVMQQLGDAANILQPPASLQNYINYYFSAQYASILQSLLTEITKIFWKTGVQIIIFLGALQGIPESYYEAARVDNAGSWVMFWKITLPLMSPMIFLNTIYTVIDSFRDQSNPIASLIVNVVFSNSNFEYGSAMGWIYFAVTFLIVGIVSLAFRRYVYYEK